MTFVQMDPLRAMSFAACWTLAPKGSTWARYPTPPGLCSPIPKGTSSVCCPVPSKRFREAPEPGADSRYVSHCAAYTGDPPGSRVVYLHEASPSRFIHTETFESTRKPDALPGGMGLTDPAHGALAAHVRQVGYRSGVHLGRCRRWRRPPGLTSQHPGQLGQRGHHVGLLGASERGPLDSECDSRRSGRYYRMRSSDFSLRLNSQASGIRRLDQHRNGSSRPIS